MSTPDIPDNVKAAVEAQGQLIAGRLQREAGFSFGNRTPAQIMWLVSLITGELVAGLVIGEITYHEANGELVRSASSAEEPRTRSCCPIVSGARGRRSRRHRADRQATDRSRVPDPLGGVEARAGY